MKTFGTLLSVSKPIAALMLSNALLSSSFAQAPFGCSPSIYYQTDSGKVYQYNPDGTRTFFVRPEFGKT